MTKPLWLRELREKITKLFRTAGNMTVRTEPPGQNPSWHVFAFPALREIVGGPDDGTRMFARFEIDLARLNDVLDSIDEMTLDSGSPILPQELRIRGWFQGNKIVARVLFAPPPNAGPDELMNADTGNVTSKR